MSASVKVAEFRQQTDRLFGLANRDYHACVGLMEIENWKRVAACVLNEVESVVCQRANAYDREQYAKAIVVAKERLEQAERRIVELRAKSVQRVERTPVRLPLALPIWLTKRPINDAQV